MLPTMLRRHRHPGAQGGRRACPVPPSGSSSRCLPCRAARTTRPCAGGNARTGPPSALPRPRRSAARRSVPCRSPHCRVEWEGSVANDRGRAPAASHGCRDHRPTPACRIPPSMETVLAVKYPALPKARETARSAISGRGAREAAPLRFARLGRRGQGRIPLRQRTDGAVDRGQDIGTEDDAGRPDVGDHLFRPGRADQGRGDVRVLEHPSDRQLSCRQAELVSDGAQLLHACQDLVGHPAPDHVGATLGVARAGAFRRGLPRLVLASEHTLGQRGPDDLGDAEVLTGRYHVGLDDAPEHRVLRLVGDQLDAELAGERVARPQLLGRPLADTDVESLSLADHVGECLHGLFQGSLDVVAVRLIEVDVVRPEPGQGTVDRLEDVLAGQSYVVVPLGPRGAEDLGEDLQGLPALPFQGSAEDVFSHRVGVDVGRVERGDAHIQCRAHTLGHHLVPHLGTVGEPVPIGDLGDLQTAVAEVSVSHERSSLIGSCRRSTTTPFSGTGAGAAWRRSVSRSVPCAFTQPGASVWLIANTYSTSAARRTTTSIPGLAETGAVTPPVAHTRSMTARRPFVSSSVLTYHAWPAPRLARVMAANPADGPSA